MKLKKQDVKLRYKNPPVRKPSRHDAIISLILGICSFIPLLNYIVSLFAIYVSYQTLRKINAHPQQYRGKWLATVGLLLGLFVTLANIFDLVYLRWV